MQTSAGERVSEEVRSEDLKYDMNHVKRGRFIIINNKTFEKATRQPVRTGTDVDCANLKITFRELGFEVEIKNDQTTTEMLQTMIAESGRDHSDSDCFGVAVLTHGVEGRLYGKDDLIAVESLVAPIKNCESLAGKPKLFFIQACRGDRLDDGVQVTVESDATDGSTKVQSARKEKAFRAPVEADFLFAYSTVPGYYAWRNPTAGSWFVQALTANLKALAFENIDLLRILTRVNYQTAYEFKSNSETKPEFDGKKEVPSIVSVLTKDLFFTKK